MGYVNKCVAVTLSLCVFVMSIASSGLAADNPKGSKIEIRMTKEVPIPKTESVTVTQWVKEHKLWVILGVALVGGAAAAAGGGGGSDGPSDGGNDGDPPSGVSDTGSVTVSW